MCWDLGLLEEERFCGVDSGGKVCCSEKENVLSEYRGLLWNGDCVEVDDHHGEIGCFLHFDCRKKGAEEVADVKRVCGLDSGNGSHRIGDR